MELDLEDDAVCNPSDNEELSAVVELSLTRRQILQGALGAAAVAFIGGPKALLAQSASRLGFGSVAVSQGGPGAAARGLHAPGGHGLG
jgi:secreted PhoX family phosphatase